LLNTTTLNEEQKDCLDTIRTSGNNLLQIVRNILDYNNLESGTRKLSPEPVSIKECFKEITDSFELSASRKSIKLTSEIAQEIPDKILGDAKGLLQILRNLTDNAIKFSKDGEVTISAQAQQQGNDSVKLTFAVEDQGIGIAVKDQSNLFQPFSQVDSTYSRQFEGTGIGLSICKRMIELMSGEIWVESEAEKGSKFSFSLDAAIVKTESEQANAESPAEEAEPISLDQQFAERFAMKILVAEDNPMNQKLITKVLKKLGYQPELANNGLEAVEMTKKDVFDLILMDLQMPEMDGIEASKIIINEIDEDKTPKIIALTANVSDEVRETCVKAGMSDYMSKPLKINKLAEILQKYA